MPLTVMKLCLCPFVAAVFYICLITGISAEVVEELVVEELVVAKCYDQATCTSCSQVDGCQWCSLEILDFQVPFGQCQKSEDACALTQNISGVLDYWKKDFSYDLNHRSVAVNAESESCTDDTNPWTENNVGFCYEHAHARCIVRTQEAHGYSKHNQHLFCIPKAIANICQKQILLLDSPEPVPKELWPKVYMFISPYVKDMKHNENLAENKSCAQCKGGGVWCGGVLTKADSWRHLLFGVCKPKDSTCSEVQFGTFAKVVDYAPEYSFEVMAIDNHSPHCSYVKHYSFFESKDCSACTSNSYIWCSYTATVGETETTMGLCIPPTAKAFCTAYGSVRLLQTSNPQECSITT